MSSKNLSGFVVKHRARKQGASLKLFSHNSSRHIVLLTQYILGLPLRHKMYEFNDLAQAEMVYDKLYQSRFERKIAALTWR